MLLPCRLALAAFAASLFALPAQAQDAGERTTVLAEARVVEPTFALVALGDRADATEEQEPAAGFARLTVRAARGAPLLVTAVAGRSMIVPPRLVAAAEAQVIVVPARAVAQRHDTDARASEIVVELVHLGL